MRVIACDVTKSRVISYASWTLPEHDFTVVQHSSGRIGDGPMYLRLKAYY